MVENYSQPSAIHWPSVREVQEINMYSPSFCLLIFLNVSLADYKAQKAGEPTDIVHSASVVTRADLKNKWKTRSCIIHSPGDLIHSCDLDCNLYTYDPTPLTAHQGFPKLSAPYNHSGGGFFFFN